MNSFPLPRATPEDIGLSTAGLARLGRVMQDEVQRGRVPGAVALTSAVALNNATLPFVEAIAGKGWRRALGEDAHLRDGLNICRGRVTHPAVARDLGLSLTSADEAIAE